ncbi:hypothetical protein [Alishewanella phage vB_AspM_Slickus01]|nr:hypothetical protein [Alishewanella phage vB_AspM_Slickus01]
MTLIIISIIFVLAGVFLLKHFKEIKVADVNIKPAVGGAVIALGLLINANAAFNYNDAGYCQHIRTITGAESAVCKTGWFFVGYGRSNAWPWAITIANTDNEDAQGSEISGSYRVRMADNWTGDVTQTTRFEIPQDEERFLNMVRKLRTPERLISSTLRPAVIASLDSVANLYTMEQYYAGGSRDQFKTEYRDSIERGRPVVKQVTSNDNSRQPIVAKVSASDSEFTQDTSDTGEFFSRTVSMEKVLDANGNERRQKHDFMDYGIVVASAILESLTPDSKFEQQIQARKDAASRRIVAQEQRKEQEEQRLLAIQTGQTNIAKRQAESQVQQIEKTTDADTVKKLALIAAEQLLEQAAIQKKTSEVLLVKAKIDAQAKQVAADAEAYEKRAILEADNALAQKLDTEVRIQTVWAQAYAKRNVPQYVFGGGSGGGAPSGSDGEVKTFMQLMTMDAAKSLNYERKVK